VVKARSLSSFRVIWSRHLVSPFGVTRTRHVPVGKFV
jgi:hypothetical protein